MSTSSTKCWACLETQGCLPFHSTGWCYLSLKPVVWILIMSFQFLFAETGLFLHGVCTLRSGTTALQSIRVCNARSGLCWQVLDVSTRTFISTAPAAYEFRSFQPERAIFSWYLLRSCWFIMIRDVSPQMAGLVSNWCTTLLYGKAIFNIIYNI